MALQTSLLDFMFSVETDKIPSQIVPLVERSRKSELGQFMTPPILAEFMAGLLGTAAGPARILDAGAGMGALSMAAIRKLPTVDVLEAWEIDPLMRSRFDAGLAEVDVRYILHGEDFIEAAVKDLLRGTGSRFTHAILNPPYKKISTDSVHRRLLAKVGIQTVNLYTAFVALSILLLQPDGVLVAIIPRSFCNGPYYRPFRNLLLARGSVEHIHVFESRTKAFRDDDVLQENVILRFMKGKAQGDVTLSFSNDPTLSDYTARRVGFDEVVHPGDEESFIHIPTGERRLGSDDAYPCELGELGLEVCTGPVVDFRLKPYWEMNPGADSVPLIYPHHFAKGGFHYPTAHKKPNALRLSEEVLRWTMPNEVYVLVKRFSSKEERRRVVAYVMDPSEISGKLIGFENHWNVIHMNKCGLDPLIARGMACFLNSTDLDQRFRQFSGHTQVNATDLRNLRYPGMKVLQRAGKLWRADMTQTEIDAAISERF